MLTCRAAVLNIVTNKVAMLLGKDETIRFLNVSIFQGAAKRTVKSIVRASLTARV